MHTVTWNLSVHFPPSTGNGSAEFVAVSGPPIEKDSKSRRRLQIPALWAKRFVWFYLRKVRSVPLELHAYPSLSW